jgi:3-dehydroquinate dehydratase-1
MYKAGGHILKIAVMPNSTEDVDRMISASRAAKEKFNRMIIPIVMGEMGQCTRIAAEAVGSFLTFGMIGEKSAPGQIDVQMLYKMMEKVHKNIGEFCGAKDSKELNNLIEKYCK